MLKDSVVLLEAVKELIAEYGDGASSYDDYYVASICANVRRRSACA